jgi:hypothetical protein
VALRLLVSGSKGLVGLAVLSTTPNPGLTRQSVGKMPASRGSAVVAVVRPGGHCWQGFLLPLLA